MPSGGTLTIETANVELDAAYVAEHPGATAGPCVMLAITDTGVGIDDAARRHLFEPFYTTKEPGTGTGLGLATVYGIVKQSGGSIFVYSEPGHGTTFKIFLPRVDRTTGTPEASPQTPSVLTGTETILLVEDQAEVRLVTRETLRRHGYTVLEAGTGDQALEMARARSEPIDLVVTDVVMPGMSGRELADRFLQQNPAARVLYMSGYTDHAVLQQGILDSGVAFIQKPFTPAALLQKVRAVLDRA